MIAMHVNNGKTIAQCLKDRTDYALNDDKTEQGAFVSSYACNAEIADKEFAESKREYLRLTGRQYKGDIIAYQIRQSFKPGEITPEEANKVGYETAMRFTKGNHAFVVATHTDREHIHNHVIFNSTNLACDRKFRDSWFIALALQKLSDLVCLEHGLSIIKPKKPSERIKYSDYEKKETVRAKICDDIDKVLAKEPKSFEEFLQLLREEEYEIKNGKHLTLKKKEHKRFVRFKSLGEGYSAEDIEKRIKGETVPEQDAEKSKRRWSRPKREFDLLIDIQEKMKQGKGGGYTRWATVYNIKQMAQTLLFLQERDIRDYQILADRATGASQKFNEVSQAIKDAEKRLGEIAVLRTHIINYAKTRDVYVAYRKSGYSKKFFEEHREEITLHKAAKEAFSGLPGQKIPKVKDLNEEYAKVLAAKKSAYAEYRQVKKEMQDYVTAKHNVDAFLSAQEKEHMEAQKRKKQKDAR